MTNQYPRTIDNGHGEQLTFIAAKEKDGVTHLEVENKVNPGSGPPLHVHYRQTERLTIIEGTLSVEILNKKITTHSEGATIEFLPGVVHRFWNSGDSPLRCKGEIWPAHNFEYFISEIFKSSKQSGKGRPSPFDAAFLLTRYQSEFGMGGIPAFVKNVVFKVVLVLGKISGADKKFIDAPAPVK